VAEVVMTIANDKGILDLDLAEVSIKRRLYRTGESEYYINNMPARLKEIREVFFDTGIGKSAYSVMEQGRIDQVLSNKPEERRLIFEEAAGITKYKARGAEAERKLEKTRENMGQVENILAEVKRNYDTLQRQAEKTLEYRQHKDDLFRHELAINIQRLRNLEERLQKRLESQREALASYEDLKKEIGSLDGELQSHRAEVSTMENRLIQGQKELYGIDLEKENFENRRQMVEEKQSEIKDRFESLKHQIQKLNEKKASLQESVGQKEKSLEEGRRELEELSKNISSYQTRIDTAHENIKTNQKEIDENQSRQEQKERDLEAAQNDLRGITDTIVTELDAGLKESGYSWQDRKNKEEELHSRLDGLRIHLQGKLDLFLDAAALDSLSIDDARKLLTSGRTAFQEAAREMEELQQAVSQYVATNPVFLDDFLSPEGIITQKRQIDARIEELRREKQSLRERNDFLAQENKALNERIDEFRKILEELRVNQVRKETLLTAQEEALAHTREELSENQKNLEALETNLDETDELRRESEDQLKGMADEWTALLEKEGNLKKELAELEKSISLSHEDVAGREKNLKDLRDRDQREQLKQERLQMEIVQIKQEKESLLDNFKEHFSRDLAEFENDETLDDRSIGDIKEDLNKAKDALRRLGQVNLMAPEEFSEVKERYDFLNGQLQDLRQAKANLEEVTKEIQAESVELFMHTYQQIKKHFHNLFRRLFGGGRAEIKLLDPQDVLTSGIEILAQPPGKKLESIALLSGGERSLTAVALLFATYMVKPSPFCVLDEIDAALDEQNVKRFVDVLIEFGEKSQFIVITHNKKTVTGAKTLLGVTMQDKGVSKLIAIRLDGENGQEEETEGDQ